MCLLDLSILAGAGLTDSPKLEFWSLAHRWITDIFGEGSIEEAESILALARQELPWKWTLAGPSSRALQLAERSFGGTNPEFGRLLACLGNAFDGAPGRELEKGERILAQADRILREKLPPDHWAILQQMIFQAQNLERRGLEAQAVALLRRASDESQSRLGNDHPLTRAARGMLARVEESLGHGEKARRSTLRPELPIHRGSAWRDDDERDTYVQIDFEDDYAEKLIEVNCKPSSVKTARLWIYSRPANRAWSDYRDSEDMRILVNHVPDHVIVFNPGLVCGYIEVFQWVPFDIPPDWLIPGENSFVIYHVSDPDYVIHAPWEYNNFWVAIDTDKDEDHSWWFWKVGQSCCDEIAMQARRPEVKPLSPFHELITSHRSVGFKESQGELMITLELIPK